MNRESFLRPFLSPIFPARMALLAVLLGAVFAFSHGPVYAAPDAPPIAVSDPDPNGLYDEFFLDQPVGLPVVMDVVANDLDGDGGGIDPATVRLVNPANLSELVTQVVVDDEGVWQVNTGTGTITFRPDISCSGVFRDEPFPMEYKVSDGANQGSNPAIVTITFDPDSTAPPILQDDQDNTVEDQPVIIDVLANDCNPEGNLDPSSVTIAAGPSHGGASPNADGTITYTPSGGYTGSDQFDYHICNLGPTPECGIASVDVIVTPRPVNQPPIVVNDSPPDIVHNQATVIDVLANDSDDSELNKNSVAVTTVAGHGNAVAATDGSGTIVYTPTSDYSGDDRFKYQVCDDGIPAPVECGQATVFLIVLPSPNQAPTANDDQAETRQNRAVTIPVLTNDLDPDDRVPENVLNPASVLVTDDPINGQASIDTTSGNITYAPNLDFFGEDTFKYTVCDSATTPLCSNEATVRVTVLPRPPYAVSDNVVTLHDTSVTIAVLDNDKYREDALNPISVTIKDVPVNGQAIKNIDNTVTYTPTLGFYGSDDFTYEICDSAYPSLCGTATVNIEVMEKINEPPVAVNDGAAVLQGQAVVIPVLDNDEDPEGALDPASVWVDPGPVYGKTQVDSNTGSITYTYTSTASFLGNDVFVYTVCDSAATPLCDSATVTVTVVALPNQAPVAVDDHAATEQNQSVTINALNNDWDPGGLRDTASVTVTVPADNGQIQVVSGTFVYTPTDLFTGSDAFTYRVCDYGIPPLCDTAEVTITVSPSVTNTIYVVDDEFAGFVNQAINGNVLANDSDPDGDMLMAPMTQTLPSHGAVLPFNVDGSFTYTPNLDYVGSDSFTYQVCDDGTPTCDTATVTVTIGTPTNVPPIAIDDAALTRTGRPVTINVLANDVDLDGALITSTMTISGPVTPGSATVDNGAIYYTPDTTTVGEVHFDYQICDDGVPAACDTATVTVDIRAVKPPIAVKDNALTLVNQSVEIVVLANDVDLGGSPGPLALSVLTLPTNGQVGFSSGLATYAPAQNFIGLDSFVYQVCDSHSQLACDSAEVQIEVIAPSAENEAYAFNDAAYVRAGESVMGNVLDNDHDPEADGWQAPTLEAPPSQGAVSLAADGAYMYTASLTFTGNDTWTYRVCDLGMPSVCASADVVITVGPANNHPIAADDWAVTRVNTTVSANLLANDSDPDGDALTVTITPVVAPSSGQVVLRTDGQFTYTPNTGVTGPDTLTYQTCDPHGLCDTADVIVDVRALNMANAAPYLTEDRAITRPSTAVTIAVLANDGDLDGVVDPDSVAVVEEPNHGAAAVKADGSILFTPANGSSEAASFAYRACDNGQPVLCTTATVTVEIVAAGSNTTYAFDDTAWGRTGQVVQGNVLVNDLDLEGNTQTVDVNSTILPGQGQLTLDPDGVFVYTSGTGYVGTDQFIYKVCDDGAPQSCTTAVAALQIFPPNLGWDFGDVSDFPTTLTADGPRHAIVAGLSLGNVVDAEANSTPNSSATTDDETDLNDEAIITAFPDFDGSGIYRLDVPVTNLTPYPAQLVGWIDWNANFDFGEPFERSLPGLAAGGGTSVEAGSVASFATGNVPAGYDGVVTLTWAGIQIPLAPNPTKVVRLRLAGDMPGSAAFFSDAGPSVTGAATGGAVVDMVAPIATQSVAVDAFAAMPGEDNKKVKFAWTTTLEYDIAGFNLLVEREGGLVLINANLIPSEVTNSTTAVDYEYADLVEGDVFYLQVVTESGEIYLHGPVRLGVIPPPIPENIEFFFPMIYAAGESFLSLVYSSDGR